MTSYSHEDWNARWSADMADLDDARGNPMTMAELLAHRLKGRVCQVVQANFGKYTSDDRPILRAYVLPGEFTKNGLQSDGYVARLDSDRRTFVFEKTGVESIVTQLFVVHSATVAEYLYLVQNGDEQD